MLTQDRISKLADSLWNARLGCVGRSPVSTAEGNLTLESAYQVSRTQFERRSKQPGIRSVGRKIGLTSLAVQKQLGVSQPDFGYLTSDMQLENGGKLPPRMLIQGKAEGEVAFLLGKPLKGPGVTEADVIAATDSVVCCIEIIDSRVRDWKIRIEDTVADNASSAYFVLGDVRRRLGDIDLRMAGMTLWRNGEIESTGMGAACLGHPVRAVQWLANRLGGLGDSLKAGDIILSGAYGPVVPFLEGDQIDVAISGLGKVSCRYGR